MPGVPQCAGHAAAAPHCSASLRLGSTRLPGACDNATKAGSAEGFEHGASPLLVKLVGTRDAEQATRICQLQASILLIDMQGASILSQSFLQVSAGVVLHFQ